VNDRPGRSISIRETRSRSSGSAGIGFDPPVRRLADRHENDVVEPELNQRLLGADQMSDVRRVEDAAEDADARRGYGLTWPVPSTTYFVVQSSRSPSGPRAWSFWVELAISAPIPNSPPSVKRVEALT